MSFDMYFRRIKDGKRKQEILDALRMDAESIKGLPEKRAYELYDAVRGTEIGYLSKDYFIDNAIDKYRVNHSCQIVDWVDWFDYGWVVPKECIEEILSMLDRAERLDVESLTKVGFDMERDVSRSKMFGWSDGLTLKISNARRVLKKVVAAIGNDDILIYEVSA